MPGIADLLDQVDVLIDGPYIERMNDNRGLRGSRNQKIHHLTERLTEYNLEDQNRQAEIHLHGWSSDAGRGTVPPSCARI